MAHRRRFRLGWEDEHLAAYLLSRVAFVARPLTVADDIGFDFLCTTYEERRVVNEPDADLCGQSAFAIQIKRPNGRHKVGRDRVEHLRYMELPYFIGVVRRDLGALDVYAADVLPLMFSKIGIPGEIVFSPINQQPEGHGFSGDERQVTLECPLLLSLATNNAHEVRLAQAEMLKQTCHRMLRNNASLAFELHLYKTYDGRVESYAGPGSIKHFRTNVYQNLYVALGNLRFLKFRAPRLFDPKERQAFEGFVKALKEVRSDVPSDLDDAVARLDIPL